jgi:diacylglycerol kinase family enzyme
MIDGEVATLQTPLNFRIRERAVRVLVPKVRAKAAEPA